MDKLMRKIMDAAYPPVTAPPGISGVMGYIGGSRATHVWTLEEWLRFTHLPQFPVWVADTGSDPASSGRAAAAAARALGWAPDLPGGQTRAIVVDMEDFIDPAWYAVTADMITARGFVPVCYGSMSTVLGNAAEHVIGALWDVIPVIPAGQTLHGLQYEANVPLDGTQVDYSVFDAWLFARGGVGPRRAA
jgi:hypothetical protein